MVQKPPFLLRSSTGIWRAFRDSYNPTWLIKRHKFMTPDTFRQKQLQSAAKTAPPPRQHSVQVGVPETAGSKVARLAVGVSARSARASCSRSLDAAFAALSRYIQPQRRSRRLSRLRKKEGRAQYYFMKHGRMEIECLHDLSWSIENCATSVRSGLFPQPVNGHEQRIDDLEDEAGIPHPDE